MQGRSTLASLGLAMLGLATLGLAGCNGLKSGDDSIHANLRFVNLMTDQATVSVLLDDATQLSSLPFEQSSSYQDNAWAASYTIKINNASNALLGSFTLAPAQKSHTTTYLYGSAVGMKYASFTDEAYTVSSGKFVVRTLLAADNLSGFDLYVTGASDDLSNLTPTVYAYAAGSMSAYSSETASGSYRVRLTLSGTKTVVFDTTMTFDSATATTLVLHTLGSSQLPTVMRIKPDDGSAVIVPNTLARLRVVQGSPDVSGSRISLDGTAAYQAVPFAGVTNYVIQSAGTHTLNFSNESTGAAFISQSQTFQPGRDYTVFSSGLSSAATALVFEDSNLAVSSSRARGRFVNATPDQASVDAVVNYQPLLSNIAAGNRSASVDLDALSYPVTFNASSNGAALAQLTTDTLVAGGAYTFALVGAANSYKAVVFKTN
ncbi:DUF4397 domain-containing protein [Chitinimonas sp.]|uniref:DUF4397 domain-containing protein n=1 Tax=Chitinimonas sp. TaxID=1934313 RepID=UPI002F94E796